MNFPPNVVELIQRQLSQFGRVGATRIYTAPALAAAIAAGASVESNPVTIRFREPGTVIALYGQELAGTAPKFASTELRIQVGGTEDLFTDGEVGTFVPFLGLFGGALNWWPMWRHATPGVDWLITYRNRDAGATATPFAGLAFIGDADLARQMPAVRV
jgi:hypothetical protein